MPPVGFEPTNLSGRIYSPLRLPDFATLAKLNAKSLHIHAHVFESTLTERAY